MNERRMALGLGALAAIAALAYGTGTVDTSGATIAVGSAPNQGRVTVDACAATGPQPVFPTINSVDIGLPALPDPPTPTLGAGGLGAFDASSNQSLAAGSYEYTDFRISSGATVTCSGAVTIRATGLVRIEGALRAQQSGHTITIHCDRLETVWGFDGQTDYRIEAVDNIEIVARDNMNIGQSGPSTRGRISSSEGNILLAIGDSAAARTMSVRFTDVQATAGSVFLNSGGEIATERASFRGIGFIGMQTLREQGNDIALSLFDSTVVRAPQPSDVVLESRVGGIDIVRGCSVENTGGDSRLAAFAGRFGMRDTSTVSNIGSGRIDVFASDTVSLSDNAILQSGDGDVRVYSRDDAVLVGDNAPGGGPRSTVSASTGSVLLRGGGDSTGVEISADGAADAGAGLTVEGAQGSVFVRHLRCSSGTLALRAMGSVSVEGAVQGRDVEVSADSNFVVSSTITGDRSVSCVAGFRITISGQITSDGPIAMDGYDRVTLDGCTIQTSTVDGVASGDIRIDTHFPFATLSAANATISSGNSDVASGDVTLRVRGGGSGGAAPQEAFLAPKSVKVKLNTSNPDKSSVKVSGVVDAGSAGPFQAGACTVDVDGAEIQGDLVAKGKKLQLKAEGLVLKLSPSKLGSSAAKLSLSLKRDLTGDVAIDDPLELGIRQGGIDARATLLLDRGRFRLGRNRGALTEPSLFPISCKASVRGGERDALALKIGFATDGTTPATAPDVTLTFGDGGTVSLPSAEWSGPSRDRFTARRPDSAPSVSKATLDYKKELLTIVLKNADLGTFPAGETIPVTIGLSLGGEQRAVTVVLSRRGSGLRY